MMDRPRGPLKAVRAIKKNNIDFSALPARSNKSFCLRDNRNKRPKGGQANNQA